MTEQTKTRMAKIFNEWARRYEENPAAFHGPPFPPVPVVLNIPNWPAGEAEDYGEQCTRFFQEISDEMEKSEILTQLRSTPLPLASASGSPREKLDKEYLSRAASLIQALLPDNHLFFLLVASVGQGGNMSYTASMRFEDAKNVMKEFLIKCGEKDEWLKHI